MAPGAVSTGVQTTRTSTPLSRPRILVSEKVSPDGLALLTPDFEVDIRQGLTPEQLIEQIPAYHGLIVRSETKVTAAVLAAGRNLHVVARAGVGVDNIDVDAATAQGIVVVNSPSGNIVAAAEHTVALLLATARNIGRADRESKEGRWERSSLVGVEVGRKTLGIIGLGKVGMKVARICAAGLGMRVLAVDPYASAERARQEGVELVPTLADLLPAVDFLTIHTPLLASTLNLLGEAEFRAMKPTARVLNVARGGVYNERALLRALDEGWIAGAGLDVYTQEPPPPPPTQEEGEEKEGNPAARLLRHPKVVATPHLGASTVEAQDKVSVDACTQVRAVLLLRGEPPTSAVNAPLIHRRLLPHVNVVNAEEKGFVISEVRVHGAKGEEEEEEEGEVAFASQVTLRGEGRGRGQGQVIEGYAAGDNVYISSFRPEGTLLILHNYDEPGKIGGRVGSVLGRYGINISGRGVEGKGKGKGMEEDEEGLGVEGEATKEVLEGLEKAEGVLDVSLVRL
ncbi:phosphoglycerate dehydrogenase [Biscogniauxia sp. FL1348]|nr:phosphoglycerate dehydrogenase [Biscogniauxia sp. FL1348]